MLRGVSALNLGSAAGAVVLVFLAWAAGGFRRPFPWKTAAGAGSLMVVLAAIVFWVPPTRVLFVALNDGVLAVLDAGNAGARFLFGPLALGPGQSTPSGEPSVGFVLATQILPAVIFFAALMSLLYHLRVMQPLVRLFAKLFHRLAGLSGAEALAGASNIFVGVESAVTVRPYLERMTRSELLTVLTCGMSTVASTTLAIYVLFLKDTFPLIAGHLISASVLSIPAAAIVSRAILPESEVPATGALVPPLQTDRQANSLAALSVGAWDGLKLAAGIATLLIAVLGVVGVLDLALGWVFGIDLARVLGWVFTPLAWLLGIAAADVPAAARVLGQRAVLTEVVAYGELARLSAAGALELRTVLVLSYALCGFAHVASVGIFVGGAAALAPSRRDDLAALGWKALVGATLATLLTGALAGAFYTGQSTLLGG